MTAWQCGYCERAFVVPSLARDCEHGHEASSVWPTGTEADTPVAWDADCRQADAPRLTA